MNFSGTEIDDAFHLIMAPPNAEERSRPASPHQRAPSGQSTPLMRVERAEVPAERPSRHYAAEEPPRPVAERPARSHHVAEERPRRIATQHKVREDMAAEDDSSLFDHFVRNRRQFWKSVFFSLVIIIALAVHHTITFNMQHLFTAFDTSVIQENALMLAYVGAALLAAFFVKVGL